MRFSIMEIKKLPGDYLLTIMDWQSCNIITLTTTEIESLDNTSDAELIAYIKNFLKEKEAKK